MDLPYTYILHTLIDTLDVIKDCYNYICDNYRFDGDEIHLIGFS